MSSVMLDRERADRLMAMGQMAASLAHEIRNPLGSMELFCTLLKKDLAEQPTTLSLAEQIHQGIRRLDRIITNCLQFTRDMNPRRKEFHSVEELLAEAVTFLRAEGDSLGVAITVEHHADGSAVWLDPLLISQAVSNVLRNAIEAAGVSPERRSVHVRSELAAATGWTLSVADSGPGISAELAERIFDPFFTTKSSGTGLGLAIVHSIVQAHGGRIEIRSDGESGTEVLLQIPNLSEETA